MTVYESSSVHTRGTSQGTVRQQSGSLPLWSTGMAPSRRHRTGTSLRRTGSGCASSRSTT
eukprot:9489755-Pyramimonas_sp.AAC.1